MKQVTGTITRLTAWMLHHFPRISGCASVSTYSKDMSCATAFAPLRGNQVDELFKVYLHFLVVEDMHFNNYIDHCDMSSFDEIVLYYGWLACGSRLTTPHLPEHVMRQFGYTQTIHRHPVVYVIPDLTRRHMDDMFDIYESHLVPEEARSTIAPSE
ncbi:unnamed protein product [Lathyrus oleraceus]